MDKWTTTFLVRRTRCSTEALGCLKNDSDHTSSISSTAVAHFSAYAPLTWIMKSNTAIEQNCGTRGGEGGKMPTNQLNHRRKKTRQLCEELPELKWPAPCCCCRAPKHFENVNQNTQGTIATTRKSNLHERTTILPQEAIPTTNSSYFHGGKAAM